MVAGVDEFIVRQVGVQIEGADVVEQSGVSKSRKVVRGAMSLVAGEAESSRPYRFVSRRERLQ